MKDQKGFISPNPIGVDTYLKYSLPFIPTIPLFLDPNNIIPFACINAARQKLKNNKSLIHISNLEELETAY
jgi:hypothetical protein